MKKKFYLLIYLVSFGSLAAWGQGAGDGSRGLSLEEYQLAKTLEIPNLEKDTYLKKEGLVFDRENPPFQFSFSDGKKRKLFLFQVFETEDLKSLGQLAVYRVVDGKQVVLITQAIPTRLAPKEVWDLYMDDLKGHNQVEPSFSTCLAFALSRQTGPLAREEDGSEEEDYEYCFPADARVQLAGGESCRIADLKPGDRILAGDPDDPGTWGVYPITNLEVHQKEVTLWQVELLPEDHLAVSGKKWTLAPTQILATANHPIASQKGAVRMDALQVGDILYKLDEKHQIKVPYWVYMVCPSVKLVKAVYNVKLDAPAYLVEGFMVYTK